MFYCQCNITFCMRLRISIAFEAEEVQVSSPTMSILQQHAQQAVPTRQANAAVSLKWQMLCSGQLLREVKHCKR